MVRRRAAKGLKDFIRKPLLAREGANATVVIDGEVVEEGPDQDYGEEGFVVQAYLDLLTPGKVNLICAQQKLHPASFVSAPVQLLTALVVCASLT